MQMLDDADTYRPLSNNPTSQFKDQLISLVRLGVESGCLTEKIAEYLIIQDPIIPIFHSFPKVHKETFPPSMRPIVAGISSLNERLCEWVDSLLQSLIFKMPSHIKGTKHLLGMLAHVKWRSEYRWVTADVTSLYLVIPHELAIRALSWFLETYSHYPVHLCEYFLLVIEFLLSHNFFMFNARFFLQVTGASMGAKFSPLSLTSTCVGGRGGFSSPPLIFSAPGYCGMAATSMTSYLFGGSDVAVIQEFNNFMNSNEHNLYFTFCFEHEIVNFLDLTLRGDRDTGNITTSTYRKKNAVNSILHAGSCHPSHVMENLPLGEIMRACRNCSLDNDFISERVAIGNRLKQRGCPDWTIQKANTIASNKSTSDLIELQTSKNNKDKYKNKTSRNKCNENSPVVFSTQYSTEFRAVSNIIKSNMPIIYTDPDFRAALNGGNQVCF
ncbi:uncharacterized protein LOC130362802 [Hyla sarda]|uniref:uncharacterized protein LOC130362802 n=1 Tax=Hyla sarda TaxID=327740 RepID=UPI0024C23C3E|nr:uncharacterized protein LOC130362802 [Hyla sarda]